uniref:Xylulose kinase n=2 Tax=Ceratitis capitata TaxID=7213 RepID=W8B422_CERCA
MVPHIDSNSTVLGFDLSTQKLKAVQLSLKLEVISTAEVKFDSDLPEFRTSGGANSGSGNNEVFVQPVMWVKAIDIVLDRLVMQGADLNTVKVIGGSAQQHGSLYWSRHGVQTLRNLDSDKFLHVQINDSAFTVNRTPIWMDGSTEKQCIEMEAAIGGRAEMVNLTGSKCYARFTGPQIRKIYQERSHAYEETQFISVVSSFLASVFLGDIAPIDYGDASGMNLFDIKEKKWSKQCLNSCAPDLEERLGQPVPTSTLIGKISPFFVQRFGFPAECKITAFTGDNLSALSGMVAEEDSLVMSLGTSDTLIMNLKEQPQLEEGHVLCHPTEVDQFMGLLCFRNGSLVRESFNKTEANGDWKKFNELLDSTPRGNYGNMALHFHSIEIIPNLKGVLRWTRNSSPDNSESAKGVKKFPSPETEIRALIEGQMLHKRAIASDMGFHFGSNTKIIATGGASVNKSILQVISDVFNAPVFVQNESEAALFGAAYRARYSLYVNSLQESNSEIYQDANTKNLDSSLQLNYHDYVTQFIPNHLQLICEPSKDCDQIYSPMLERYRQMAFVLEQA